MTEIDLHPRMQPTDRHYTLDMVREIAEELVLVVDDAFERLSAVDEDRASEKPAPHKWSFKEIIGHLIDSASNNHQRFVRAPAENVFRFPAYEQDYWVSMQGYDERSWIELLELWRAYNHHVAHVMTRIPEEKLRVECLVESYKPSSLGFLVEDYLAHLKHHLKALP